MFSIDIDVLWTLRDLRNSPESWSLYVNFIPMYESQKLRDFFYDSTQPDVNLSSVDPSLLDKVIRLVEEIRPLLPEPEPFKEEGLVIKTNAAWHALTHYPNGTWSNKMQSVAEIRWARKIFIGSKELDTERGYIIISSLSSMAQYAIKLLDGIAIETSYRRHLKSLDLATEQFACDFPPPRKIPVFIAYRRSCVGATRILHNILLTYGNQTCFLPFLDLHDMRLGDWKDQLFERIEKSRVFMPIVTDDYAEVGSVSYEEFEKADEINGREPSKLFFAPIFIGRPEHRVAQRLSKEHALMLRTSEDLSPERADVQRYLRTVLASAMAVPR